MITKEELLTYFFELLFLYTIIVFCMIGYYEQLETGIQAQIKYLESIAEPIPETIEETEEIEEAKIEIEDPLEEIIELMEEDISELDKILDRKEWFIRYKDIQNRYSEWLDKDETIYDYYDQNELQLLFRAVETEVHGGDFESKTHVASVVFNRLDSPTWENNLTGVLTHPNQFALTKTNITEDTILACEYAFQFGDTANGATHFHSGSKSDMFCGKAYIFSDAVGHHFY